jgi:hypothetical protein
MACGPGTILDADPGAHRLCSGKTTITGPLRSLLPGCLVLEADVILHVAALG